MYCNAFVAKTKAVINCSFVFAYAKFLITPLNFSFLSDSGNPRKGYNPDFPPEQINRYEQRFYNTHYNRGRTYSDDRDYWRYNRYHDRDDLFDRPSFQRPRVNDFHDNRVYDHHNNRGYDHHDNRGYDHHDNREYEHHDNRGYVNHDNRGYDFHNDRGFGSEDNDKPQIWYTRQIIEYYDNGNTRSSYDEHVGVPRHPVEPRTRERLALEEAPPSPKEAVPIIILPPEDAFTDLDEPPVAPVESVAILNDSPIESYVATSQNVVLDIDHEPEHLTTEYKDLGFYALDDTDERRENASIMPRQIGDNTAYIHNEPLYAKPFKPKAKVTIFEGEGRRNPGSHDDQIVPYRSKERLDDNNIGNGWLGPYQQRTDERYIRMKLTPDRRQPKTFLLTEWLLTDVCH